LEGVVIEKSDLKVKLHELERISHELEIINQTSIKQQESLEKKIVGYLKKISTLEKELQLLGSNKKAEEEKQEKEKGDKEEEEDKENKEDKENGEEDKANDSANQIDLDKKPKNSKNCKKLSFFNALL
jgi:hypothetical protein